MLKKIVKSKLFPKVKLKQQLNDIVKQFYQDIQQMSQNYDYENLDNIYKKVINEIKNISDTDKHKELTNDFLNKVSVTYEIEKQKEKNLNDKFDIVFQKMKDMTIDEKQYWILNSRKKVVMKNGILYLLNENGTKTDVFPYLNKIQSNNFNQFKNNYIKYINDFEAGFLYIEYLDETAKYARLIVLNKYDETKSDSLGNDYEIYKHDNNNQFILHNFKTNELFLISLRNEKQIYEYKGQLFINKPIIGNKVKVKNDKINSSWKHVNRLSN
jgi:hypothetical protein